MKSFSLLLSIVLFVFFTSCNDSKNDRTEMLQEIKKVEKTILADTLDFLNFKDAGKVIVMYDEFVNKYKEDSLSPMFLFRKAEITMNTGQHDLSLKTFNEIIQNYPEYKDIDRVYFMKAFLLENYIKDIDKAKEAYNQFILKFPNNELIEDAKISIQNIGKSPEELILEFESKKTESIKK
ncbi:MAG: hypothetical protein A2X12_07690 [Bacteroidetes bacterium GWE2_29_8]|nr:MAG: hypothetical protein A2X12_07690 [Bacteroidetes bacterium GWE2_29_8]OFY15749.1 MAG: hypothetical protein A2X02_00175 [Bacteroidetes bacterium GWF2_29_10]